MTVLARELDAYQRAYDQYNRAAKSHNRQLDAYQGTLAKDAQGRVMVLSNEGSLYSFDPETGKSGMALLPEGKRVSDYGLTPMPDNKGFMLLRENPTVAKRDVVQGAVYRPASITSQAGYYDPAGNYLAGRGWGIDDTAQVAGAPMAPAQKTYTMSRDASTYAEAPPEFTREFNLKQPDPTHAALARMSRPTLAEVETGLIGQVLRGNGAR